MHADSPRSPAPASQRTVRQHNRAIVLAAVAGRPGRNRAQLAQDIGVTRTTVSTLVDQLIASGLLVEREPSPGLRGRPGSRLELNPLGPAAIGVQVDVDRTSAVLLDLTGTVRDRRVVDVDNSAAAPAVVLRRAARMIDDLGAGASVVGVRVAFPGLVSSDGVVIRAPNLRRWEGVRPADLLAERLHVPVVGIDNEANLAALAERWHGARLEDFIHVSGEIGVGGGVVVGGRLFRGVRGFAGELGHVLVDPRGPECGCGNRGCLEQLAGRSAVLAKAEVSSETELLERCERGEAKARRAVRGAAVSLAVALAGVINTLDLPAVSLGGFYARVAPWCHEELAAELSARVLSGVPVQLHVSSLGRDAAALGAAGQVIHDIVRTGGRHGALAAALP